MSTRVPHERQSTSDTARSRAFLRDALPAMVTLVVLQGSLLLIDPDGGASGWNLLWSVLPLIPAAWLVWAQVRSVRRADEFQRIMQLQAMSIGFGAMILLSMTGGLLDAADVGSPSQWLQITFIGGVLVWIAALALATWRAR